MRKALLLSILFIASQICFGQKFPSKIDSLNSEKDIQDLLLSMDERFKDFTIQPITKFKQTLFSDIPCKRIADSLKITKSFYKSDFDNNGYTDLLVIGKYRDFHIYVIMNYGSDSLWLNRLTRGYFQDCAFPRIINDTLIRYYHVRDPKWTDKDQSGTLLSKDLIFKFGDFIEYNPRPKHYSIEKIEYQTTVCFGTCPEFYISITNDRSSTFKATAYNEGDTAEIEGTFTAVLKEASFAEIINLLNYIDFPKLNDNYAVRWTDDQTCTLTITYDNGKVKRIRDYGLIGTYGLDRLYQLFFELRYNQEWK